MLPVFPDASVYFSKFICIIAVIMVIYASFIAFYQKEMKKVIAYSSIAHMGIIILGIFSMNPQGLGGAIFLMISHGVVVGGLFMLCGFIYDRKKSDLINEFGGIAKVMPICAVLFCIVILGNIGMPLTTGFVGEFLSLLGIFRISPILAFFGGLGIIMSAIFSLNLYSKLFFGKITDNNKEIKDLNIREILPISLICAVIFTFGIFPKYILNHIDDDTYNIIQTMQTKCNSDTKQYILNSRSLNAK